MIIFADRHTIKHILNSKTEAHSDPLWIVGERANKNRDVREAKEIAESFKKNP